MSQLIACKNKHGIILAADSKAIDFDPNGELVEFETRPLIQLTPHSGILAGGAAEAEKMCQALKEFIAAEGIGDIEDVYGVTLPFLASEYDRFMRKHCEIFPLDTIHQVYFLLGGYGQKDPQSPYRLYLIWTKQKRPQLDGDEISVAFTVPRIIRLEHKLNRLCKENRTLEEILPEIQTGLEKQAETLDEVGPPFWYAVITSEGFRAV